MILVNSLLEIALRKEILSDEKSAKLFSQKAFIPSLREASSSKIKPTKLSIPNGHFEQDLTCYS